MNASYSTDSNVSETKKTTLSLNLEAYRRLKQHGKFGESFSELICRLLNEVERKETAQ